MIGRLTSTNSVVTTPLRCPRCGISHRHVNPAFSGRNARCGKCRQRFVVPGTSLTLSRPCVAGNTVVPPNRPLICLPSLRRPTPKRGLWFTVSAAVGFLILAAILFSVRTPRAQSLKRAKAGPPSTATVAFGQ